MAKTINTSNGSRFVFGTYLDWRHIFVWADPSHTSSLSREDQAYTEENIKLNLMRSTDRIVVIMRGWFTRSNNSIYVGKQNQNKQKQKQIKQRVETVFASWWDLRSQ